MSMTVSQATAAVFVLMMTVCISLVLYVTAARYVAGSSI